MARKTIYREKLAELRKDKVESTAADKRTMSQEWWQLCAEELAAKVRGYFTNSSGKVEIGERMNGDWDLYRTASRLTTRTVQPGKD